MLTSLLVVIAALLLDRLLGEPKRRHPLVGFGRLANLFEAQLNQADYPYQLRFLFGLLALLVLCGGLAALLALIYLTPYGIAAEVVLLYLAIAPRSLREHALAVYHSLQHKNIAQARQQVSFIVSRETRQMDESQISRAVIESTLENGNDAIFAALFWFLIAGIPGVVVYRLVNTLDAMWGYRTPRYEWFGKSVAHLDDLLNYLPARLTALSYALCGHFSSAIRCWHKQAHQLASPNGGPVMSAGAGALQRTLGGTVTYHGILTPRPHFGCGDAPQLGDIKQALKLVTRTLWLWLTILILIAAINGFYYA